MSQKETIKKVLRYIKKYSFFVICSLVLAVITVALTLYVPILTGNAVDVIVGPGAGRFWKSYADPYENCHCYSDYNGGAVDHERVQQ